MYSEFYQFRGKPFQLSPDPRFFYASEGHQRALAYLRYGLHEGEGFMVVTGDVGTGKTTLLSHLLDTFDRRRSIVAKLVSTQVGPDDTLRLVASAFGLKVSSVDKAVLLRQLERFLIEHQQRGKRVVLFVDEVQNLPVGSLEELRMLSNFQSESIAPIQFCLIGQPQFQQILASGELMQLRQRVIASYHLGPLGEAETRAYVEHRLRLVGWKDDPAIDDPAFSLMHRYTAGVPRQINVLCNRLLLYGMLEERHRIDAPMVEEVQSEMLREGTRTPMDILGAPQPGMPKPNGQAHDLSARVRNVIAELNSSLEERVGLLEARADAHQRAIRRMLETVKNYVLKSDDPSGIGTDEK
ncbi:MAG: XrtA/PEP-CTERM system-associated ATPase [Stellaceae bacterium]